MREFKPHRSKQEELFRLGLRAAGVLCLLVLTALLAHAAWGMYEKMIIASQGQEEAEHQLALLREQEQGASTTLDEISSARGQEAQIRERYALAKPGEGEIDIIHQAPTSTTAGSANEPWWQRIFNAFKLW